jgi:hypothetical protein
MSTPTRSIVTAARVAPERAGRGMCTSLHCGRESLRSGGHVANSPSRFGLTAGWAGWAGPFPLQSKRMATCREDHEWLLALALFTDFGQLDSEGV